VRVVPDVIERIAEGGERAARRANDYLFTTGGIGPTHDDITVDAIAAALGVPWSWIRRRGRSSKLLRDARRAHRGAAAHGAGARRRRADREPDVGRARHPPRQHLHPRRRAAHRRDDAGGAFGHARGRQAAALGDDRLLDAESEVAELLGEVERGHEGCQIGSYPFFREGRVGANFVIRSTEADLLEACRADLLARLLAAGREAGAEVA
jgi:molybdopterin-biosynthesis enzyme MoeA-like protein